jgi:copper chaperone CopZ
MKDIESINREIAEKHDPFLKTQNIRIHDLECDNCISSLDELFMSIDGVMAVRVNPDDQVAEVTFDTRKTNLPLIHEILLRSGYKKE